MGKTETEQDQQLITEEIKEKKTYGDFANKKDRPESKGWVVFILFISVLASLIFYLISRMSGEEKIEIKSGSEVLDNRENSLLKPKVYEF